MNERTHSSQSEPARKSSFRGWGWFAVPVVLNLLVFTMPIFDGGYTNAVSEYFSIPYLVVTTIIGTRRGRGINLVDLLFLAFGNFSIVSLLWTLKNPASHL